MQIIVHKESTTLPEPPYPKKVFSARKDLDLAAAWFELKELVIFHLV